MTRSRKRGTRLAVRQTRWRPPFCKCPPAAAQQPGGGCPCIEGEVGSGRREAARASIYIPIRERRIKKLRIRTRVSGTSPASSALEARRFTLPGGLCISRIRAADAATVRPPLCQTPIRRSFFPATKRLGASNTKHPGIGHLLRAVSTPKYQVWHSRVNLHAAHFLQAIGSSWLLPPASGDSASA
jgi:hypothetical protein